jgi:hypothetical protein
MSEKVVTVWRQRRKRLPASTLECEIVAGKALAMRCASSTCAGRKRMKKATLLTSRLLRCMTAALAVFAFP